MRWALAASDGGPPMNAVRPIRLRIGLILGLALTARLAGTATKAEADEPSVPATVEEARRVMARAIEESGPDRPEWVDMLADILQGSQLGPGDGWFRTAVSRTRFSWEATRRRWDRDGNERITRDEFPGNDPDFARL